MSIPYRPETDGLRALAVVAVIVYHAGFTLGDSMLLTGGFLGVDVFFVISGYLLTAILVKDMRSGQFSLLQFYERRARRILPALFLMMAATLPVALLVLDAQALREYARSAFAALGFVANIGFWLEDAYTAAPSALKPLLHTWSLAVEEQFYLLFPIALVLLLRASQRLQIPIMLLALLLSLGLAQYGSEHFASAAFFLLPTRAWELLAGVVLALLETRRARNGTSMQRTPLTVLGLLLICGAFVGFDDDMRHPSLLTVVPVAGTMLIIWFGTQKDYVCRLLSAKPVVTVGLLSYSLYLWHFPVFAFARSENLFVGNANKLLLTGVAILLAVVAWRTVELPMRNRARISARTLTFALTATLAGIATSITVLHFHSVATLQDFSLDGRTFDIDTEKARRYEAAYAACGNWELDKCATPRADAVNILVVGDSMAVDANNMFGPLYPDYHFAHSSLGGCPPHPAIRQLVGPDHPDLERCLSLNTARFDGATLAGFDGVIIDLQLDWFTAADLKTYLQHLADQGMSSVIVLGNYLRLDRELPELVRENAATSFDHARLRSTLNIVAEFALEAELQALADSYGFEFISIAEYACTAGTDCTVFVDGYPFTWDEFHFSVEFAEYVGKQLQPALTRTWLQQLSAE